MKTLLLLCAVAVLALGSARAQEGADAAAVHPAQAAAPSKDSKKEVDKRPKPKPTKKPRKSVSRTATP